MPTPQYDPSPILQTAFAFWSSKVLLTAVEMGLFTRQGHRQLTGAELGERNKNCTRAGSAFFSMRWKNKTVTGATSD